MTVKILVTIPREELFENCTTVFKTIHVGFPTAHVVVYDNSNEEALTAKLKKLAKTAKCDFIPLVERIHHANWIRSIVNYEDSPLVIVDPDVIFWESCEDLKFEGLWAGYHTPLMWNEFAQTVSAPRVHTSFLWFNDPRALMKAVKLRYPNAHDSTGAYSPCDPFMPDVKFVNGKAMFWDSCANLYNMIRATHFSDDVLLRYDHVPSSAFYDVMKERVCDPKGFEIMHSLARTAPEKLRNMWPGVKRYYEQMNQIAKKCLTS